MISRRRFIKTTGGVALALGVPTFGIGCRRNISSTSASSYHEQVIEKVASLPGIKGRTLNILYPKGSLGNLDPIVKAFRRHTRVNISLEEASLDEISGQMVLANQVQAGDRFDVALPATFGIPDLAEAGAIAELDDLEKQFEPKGFLDTSLYTLGDRYKGKLYGYQTDGDVYMMFYLRKWLTDPRNQEKYQNRYGRKLAVPKTWEELDRQIRFFHSPSAGRFGGSLYRNKNYVAWEFWARLHGKGLFPVSDDFVPQVNSDEAKEALSQLIATSKHLEPGAVDHGLFDNFESFAQGDKYCNVGWGGTQKYLRSEKSKIRSGLTYGQIPGGIAKDGSEFTLPYFNWGWNYVVSSKSKSKELAYLFILFASTPVESTVAVREASGFFDPFRSEHYDDPAITEMYGKTFLDTHREGLTNCIPDFYVRGQGRYMGAVKQAVFAASQDQVSIERALDAVAAKWEKLTDSYGRQEQVRQWEFLKNSYPVRLREVLS